MVRYISLLRFSEQGIAAIKNSTDRAKAFRTATDAAGVRLVGQFWTIGSYDGVLILEADSEKKVLACLANLASTGAVRPETMQAFTAEEFAEIVGS